MIEAVLQKVARDLGIPGGWVHTRHRLGLTFNQHSWIAAVNWYNYARTAVVLRHWDECLRAFDRAIALKPDFAEAHMNRGNCLCILRRLDAALESYTRAIEIRPNDFSAYQARGNASAALGAFDAARDDYRHALALKPNDSSVLDCLGQLLSLRSDLENGQPLYQHRHARTPIAEIEPSFLEMYKRNHRSENFSQPWWLGEKSIVGKTILLWAEQGICDTLQFCRFAPLVAALGARVIMEVQKPIAQVLANFPGVSQIVPRGDPLPDFDVHCSLMSLPHAFKTNLDTIPASVPYLYCDQTVLTSWQARLGKKSKPRIGLCWWGCTLDSFLSCSAPDRSLLLSELVPHLPSGFEYVSLHAGAGTVLGQRL